MVSMHGGGNGCKGGKCKKERDKERENDGETERRKVEVGYRW